LSYEEFDIKIKEAAGFFNKLPNNEVIRIISHIDADGICSASLIIKLLNLQNRKYSVSIVPALTSHLLDEYKNENYKIYIVTDLGSGALSQIAEALNSKKVIILDHHTLESKESFDNIMHVNPHEFGIDGGMEISGAGVSFLFAREVDSRMEMFSYLAIIGAIGDVQDKDDLIGLNKKIMDIAVTKKKINVVKTLRFFGINTRPLYKILEYSNNPRIPGVTGSESSAIQFLTHLGINPKKGDDWRLFTDLSEDDKKKLALGIIMRRKDEPNADDIFGNSYQLVDETDPQLMNVKEFATLLNACGRLGKASFGIGACLNDPKIKKKAISTMQAYKREIVAAMNWYRDNSESESIIKEDGFMIIHAEDNILPTMIGTISSMISKSGNLKENTYLMSLARNNDRTTKISLRITGENNSNIDLRGIISEITRKIGGEAGGHMNAAGAVIPTKNEKDFIDEAKLVLRRVSMEMVLGS